MKDKKEKKNKKIEKSESCTCNGECNCGDNCECGHECHCDDNSSCSEDNKFNELQDKYLRLQAEYMNFRNRTTMDVANMLKYEGEEFIKSLLPTIDNFERAIILDDNDLSDEVSKFLSGIKMIYGNLIALLDTYEVKPIDALGREFDPNLMEAVLTEHDESKPANAVTEVLTKGYMYKDKVIRHAMVKVNN